MSCSSKTKYNFNNLVKETGFTEKQLVIMYNQFISFSKNNKPKLDFYEFKSFLGIIGRSDNIFICRRLMHLINRIKVKSKTFSNQRYIFNNSNNKLYNEANFNLNYIENNNIIKKNATVNEKVSFESYIYFLSLVTYGNNEDKLTYTFNFFDLNNSKKICKENFTEVLYNICEFLATISNSKLNLTKLDLDEFYDDLLNKYSTDNNVSYIDYNTFCSIFNSTFEDFDLFNIFNVNFKEENTAIINKKDIEKLSNLENKLKNLYNKMYYPKYNKDIILTLKNLISFNFEQNYNKYIKKNTYNSNTKLQNDNFLSFKTNNFRNSKFCSKDKGIYDLDHLNDLNNYAKVERNIYKGIKNSKYNFDYNKQSYIDLKKPNFTIKTNSNINIVCNNFSNINNNYFTFDNNKQVKQDSHLSVRDDEYFSDAITDSDNNNNIVSNSSRNDNNLNVIKSMIEEVKTYPNNGNFQCQLQQLIDIKNNYNKKLNFYKNLNTKESSQKTLENIKPKKLEITDFDIIAPSVDNIDEPQLNLLKNLGLNPDDIFIINNKNKFIDLIESLHNEIRSINLGITNNKKQNKRRKGISINIKNDAKLDKEDFFNTYKGCCKKDKGLIHLGSNNIDLVLSMMIGLKCSINSLNEFKNNYNLFKLSTLKAFEDVCEFRYSLNTGNFINSFNTNNFNVNNKDYEKKINNNCIFTDYSYKVFDNIRKMYGINNNDYLKSLGPENFLGNLLITNTRSLKELVSYGKSGSFFYFSYDSKYLIKTISKNEFEFFKIFIKNYYNYMLENPETLIQRYYGLHSLYYKDKCIYFVVMNNFFNTNIKIDYKYDLKGSSYNRISRDEKDVEYKNYDFSIPLKDNDLRDREEKFILNKQDYNFLISQIIKDIDFLSINNINDYSLLIGVHNIDYEVKDKNMFKSQLIDESKSNLDNINCIYIRKPFFEAYKGGLITKDLKNILYLGIIDILTEYSGKKMLEHNYKKILMGNGISCQPPKVYSKRFIDFINKIFIE